MVLKSHYSLAIHGGARSEECSLFSVFVVRLFAFLLALQVFVWKTVDLAYSKGYFA